MRTGAGIARRPGRGVVAAVVLAGIWAGIWAGTARAYVAVEPGTAGDLATTAGAELVVTVNAANPRQTIASFGASDCWSTQFIGQWPDSKRHAIADLLFHQGLDGSDNPRGIGLSTWRMNLGAGSSRQTSIASPWRRADCYYNAGFTGYDWSRCPGQRWFLQAAKARGVEEFLAFVNSPPITMTKNGQAYCDSSVGSTNLRSDKIDAFGVYLADVLEHFRDAEGIEFDYVSPVNEPQWDWNGNGQEGCRYNNGDIAAVVRALYPKLQNRGLDTEIVVSDAGQIDYLYDTIWYNSAADDQIDEFFNAGSGNYIGDKVAWQMDSHSYWTDTPGSGLVTKRQSLRSKLDEYGLGYAMSEYCILGDYGPGRDRGIDPAIHIARTIHYDLAVANASSWQWWLGVSPYDYKDGLVYTDFNQTNGNYYDSKMLWAVGNFSRFVRPGMKRVGLSRSDGAGPAAVTEGLMVSAYRSAGEQVNVVVLVNWTSSAQNVRVDVNNLPGGESVCRWIPYVTSAAHDLAAHAAVDGDAVIAVPARSVVTLVSENRAPFGGSPAPVPGAIEAEDFDEGGEGVGYHDSSAGNAGGAYRMDEGVDIVERGAGEYAVWTADGEWLEYTVDVAQARCRVGALVSAGVGGRALRVLLDGREIATLDVPVTPGGAYEWVTVTGPDLAAKSGAVLRFEVVGGGYYLDRVSIERVEQWPYGGIPRPAPGAIEAEDYDEGGEGYAYHDTSSGNSGGAYRMDNVDIIANGAGGYSIWTSSGEWLEYTIDSSGGVYDVAVRLASSFSGRSVAVQLGGGPKHTLYAPNTSGAWTTVLAREMASAAGEQVLRLDIPVGGIYVDRIELMPSAVRADLDRNGQVDLGDFAALAGAWAGPVGSVPADIAPPAGDARVDVLDLAVLIDAWLDATQ